MESNNIQRPQKRRIRVVSDMYNANALDLIGGGDIERTKFIARFSLWGMAVGTGYCLLTKRSVLFGLLAGTLSGMAVGTLIQNYKNKVRTNKIINQTFNSNGNINR